MPTKRGANIIKYQGRRSYGRSKQITMAFDTIDNGIYLMPNESIKIYDESHFGGHEYVTSIANIDSLRSYILLRNGKVFENNLSLGKVTNCYETKGALGQDNLYYDRTQR